MTRKQYISLVSLGRQIIDTAVLGSGAFLLIDQVFPAIRLTI